MTDIPRAKVEELRAKAAKEHEQILANLNATSGAIAAFDMLLAAEPDPQPDSNEQR